MIERYQADRLTVLRRGGHGAAAGQGGHGPARDRVRRLRLLPSAGGWTAPASPCWASAGPWRRQRRRSSPRVGGDPEMYWAYDQLGAGVSGRAARPWSRDPLVTLMQHLLQRRRPRWTPLAIMLWPTLAAVPVLAAHADGRCRTSWSGCCRTGCTWWITDFHHSAFTVVILTCAGVDGLIRVLGLIKRREDRGLILSWSVAVCAIAITLLPRFALDQLVHPAFYQRDARAEAAAAGRLDGPLGRGRGGRQRARARAQLTRHGPAAGPHAPAGSVGRRRSHGRPLPVRLGRGPAAAGRRPQEPGLPGRVRS